MSHIGISPQISPEIHITRAETDTIGHGHVEAGIADMVLSVAPQSDVSLHSKWGSWQMVRPN